MASFPTRSRRKSLRTCLPLTAVAWSLLTLVPAFSAAPAKPAAKPKAEPLHYASLLRLPGSVTLATLSNGLTVIVQENHVAPVATVRCFVKNTGSAFES